MQTGESCKRKSCGRGKSLGPGRGMFRVKFGKRNISPSAWKMLEKAEGDKAKLWGTLFAKQGSLKLFPSAEGMPVSFYSLKDVKSVPSTPSLTAHALTQACHSFQITAPVSPLATWPAVTPPPSRFSHGPQRDIPDAQACTCPSADLYSFERKSKDLVPETLPSGLGATD